MGNCAVFLDRDGVIVEDRFPVLKASELVLLPRAAEAIAYFCRQGFHVFVVTNQPVVARGLLTEKLLSDLHEEMCAMIQRIDPDARIAKVYACPHHPQATIETYRVSCPCRKPKSGMIDLAVNEFELQASASYMVGDRMTDMKAGELAGCRTVLVESPHTRSRPIETDLKFDPEAVKIDYRCQSLFDMTSFV